MDISVVVDASGWARAYVGWELAGRLPFLTKDKQGWWTCSWLDLPELAQHGKLCMDDESKTHIKDLRSFQVTVEQIKRNPPPEQDGFSELFRDGKKPYPFQRQAMRLAHQSRRLIIAEECGLGKTVESIGVMLAAFRNGEIDAAVIVCPGSLRYQWVHELTLANDYIGDLEEHVIVVDGDKWKRMEAYESGAQITIMGYPSLIRDHAKVALMLAGKRHMVIADEATGHGGIKDRTTKTAKAFKRAFGDAAYRLALTATPVENGLGDIYSVMEWIDPTRLGTYKQFMANYCRTIKIPIRNKATGAVRFYTEKVIGYKNVAEVKSRLQDRMIRRTADEVGVQMPEVVTLTRRVELSVEAREIYDRLAGVVKATKDVAPGGILGLMTPLQRCCAAPCLVGGKGEDSGKIEELIGLLEGDLAGHQVVVVTRWHEKWIDILARDLAAWKPVLMHGDVSDEDREAARMKFQSGDAGMMIMTEVGQYGMNLEGGSILVNLDLGNFNPAGLHQRIGRIYRVSSKHKVIRVVAMIAANTIEERVADIIAQKGDLFATLFRSDGIAGLTNKIVKMTDADWRKLL